jgi:galactonate dehydratase
MKITGFKTFVVAADSNWVFVQVYTDEGVTGLGEGSVSSKTLAVEAAIRDLERFVVGRDPRDIEALWQEMYRYPRWKGGPVLSSAISAIEIALWDILGQTLDVPVYQLLGGRCRDRIRMYTHVAGETPAEAAEQAVALVEQGYTAVKTGGLLVNGEVVKPHEAMRLGAARIEAIREAVGPDIDILIDAHCQMTPQMAVAFADRIAEYEPFFFEEPTRPEDLGALEWVSQHSQIPLATGEQMFTKFGFTEVCDKHLVNYIQPDVIHCGGISEMKKIAAIAEAHFIDCAPHNPQSFVSTMASLHVDACTTNCVIQEFPPGPEWQSDLFIGGPEITDGYASLPSGPGLGVRLNEEVAAVHPYDEALFRPQWRWEDGSVADWA